MLFCNMQNKVSGAVILLLYRIHDSLWNCRRGILPDFLQSIKYLWQFAAMSSNNYTSGFAEVKEVCGAVHCCNVMGLLIAANILRKKKKAQNKM